MSNEIIPDSEPVIAYSIRELLKRMDEKLDGIVNAMVTKVDRAEFARLQEDVREHQLRLAALEADKQSAKAARDTRRWMIGTIMAAVTAIGAVVVVFLH